MASVMRCPTCHRDYEQGYLRCPYDGATLLDTTAAAAANDPFIGRELAGTYQIVRRLGSGGMGAVYEARHVRLDSSFAIKLLHLQLSPNEEMLARFHREARSASQLKHPNILDVFDVNKTEDNVHYIVEEFLDGMPLSVLLDQEGTLSVERAAHIVGQVCDAMAAAHAKGIVHRDLKPENIFLIAKRDDPDFVKVLDFGIAKMQQEGKTQLTQAAQVMGTPDYISPEQAADSKQADARSDIYSMGVVLYRIFTGRLPYEVENPILALEAVRREDPVLPRQRRPDLPPAIEAVILRAIARDPDSRYETMQQLQAAVEGLVGQVEVPTVRAIPATVHNTPLPPTMAAPTGPPEQRAAATGPQAQSERIAPASLRKPAPAITPMIGPTDSTQRVRGGKKGLIVAAVVSVAAIGGLAALMSSDKDPNKPTRVDAGMATTVDATKATPVDAAVAAADQRTPDAGPPTVAGMVFIKGGRFTMGRADGSALEKPTHSCQVESFHLDVAEVTEKAFAASSAKGRRKDPLGDRLLPVVNVTWGEADGYCRSQGKRLPTETEWEYAARGDDHRSVYPGGNELPAPEEANFCREKKKCKGAALRSASPEAIRGLKDIIGNAGEWVADRFGAYTAKCGTRAKPPRAFQFGGAYKKFRIIRGASFGDYQPERLSATYRFFFDASKRLPMVGFRCARDVSAKK